MKLNPEKLQKLINQIDEIIRVAKNEEKEKQVEIDQVSSVYERSARNLIHYKALRRFDLRKLQKKLGYLGSSRLSLAESHVMDSLLSIKRILQALSAQELTTTRAKLSIKRANKLLKEHTDLLLGDRPKKGRRVRIMVTQPTESAYNYELVQSMVQNGMNCARINSAHDSPEIWLKIINNVHRAAEAVGKGVKIAMDLAGPKIRTGPIVPGAKVRKFTPERNEMGHVINPAVISLVSQIDEDSDHNTIPVDKEWMSQLKPGDKITLKDTRSKDRTLKVIEVTDEHVYVNCYDTSYMGTGTVLSPQREGLNEIVVGELPPIEQALLLRVNDEVVIHRSEILGEPAQFDQEGNLLRDAHIGCTLPEVFAKIRVGERVLFDDGKIEGKVIERNEDSFAVLITQAKELGTKLKAEKGINFPTTELGISGLTEKDKKDLEFIAQYADAVNFSFVNSAADVLELLDEFEKLGATDKLNIILKIETRQAFDNLKDILLTAMKVRYVGVMIARGDLAVETGWDIIGWVQNEILSVCNAAHIPVIWATQVLENMAKKGLPSRSEITDATTGLKAECVMLNKGAYINQAISLLHTILTDMEVFQEKNESMLPQMGKLSKK